MRNNSFNINSLAKHFGIRFDFNHVKDSKNHWKSAEYFPLITNFNKSHLTKNVNKLYYSGATLTLNRNDCYPIAFTSKDAEPPNSPIIAISSKGHCIAIGGSTMFYDDEYGISAGNNSVFVSNLFKYLIWAKKYPDKVIEYRQISPRPDFSTRKIPLKKASEILNKKIKEIYNDYNKIFDKIDKLMDNIINIYEATGIDVADKIAKYLYDETKKHKTAKHNKVADKILTDNIDRVDKEQTLITSLDYRGSRVLLPEVITKAAGMDGDDDYEFTASIGKVVVKKFDM